MKPLDDIAVVVLDLDDTLYLERDYVRSGFNAVSAYLEKREVYGFVEIAWNLFESGTRGLIFDKALKHLGISNATTPVTELVEIYRQHVPAISVCSDSQRFLDQSIGKYPLALISDGPVRSQNAKLDALGIRRFFDFVILTDHWGIEFRKPHSRSFENVEEFFETVPKSKFVYIADNPAKDFVTPIRRGWRTIRLRRPLSLHESEEGSASKTTIPYLECATFDEFL